MTVPADAAPRTITALTAWRVAALLPIFCMARLPWVTGSLDGGGSSAGFGDLAEFRYDDNGALLTVVQVTLVTLVVLWIGACWLSTVHPLARRGLAGLTATTALGLPVATLAYADEDITAWPHAGLAVASATVLVVGIAVLVLSPPNRHRVAPAGRALPRGAAGGTPVAVRAVASLAVVGAFAWFGATWASGVNPRDYGDEVGGRLFGITDVEVGSSSTRLGLYTAALVAVVALWTIAVLVTIWRRRWTAAGVALLASLLGPMTVMLLTARLLGPVNLVEFGPGVIGLTCWLPVVGIVGVATLWPIRSGPRSL